VSLISKRKYLALRCFLIVSFGLVLGFFLPIPWWICLTLAILIAPSVFLINQRILYAVILLMAISYGKIVIPTIANKYYYLNLTLEGKLIGKTGKYSILLIESPEQLKNHKVLIYSTRNDDIGSKYSIQGKLLPLSFPVNPGTCNRNKRLAINGIIGRMASARVDLLEKPYGLRKLLNSIHKAFVERNLKIFTNEGNLFSAILLGEKTNLDENIYKSMKRTGTLHLLAVSGLHVGIIAAFIFIFLRLFYIPRFLILPLLGILLLIYAGLVGFRPSILRASVMSLAVAAGFTFERKVLPLNSLAAAGLLILLLNPAQIMDVGFQLSFAAAFGIIFAVAMLQELSKFKKVKIPKPVLRWLLTPLFFSLSATLFTMPFLAQYFHKITFAPLLANLLIIPLVSLTLPLGLISLGLSFIYLPLGEIFGNVVSGLFWLLENLLRVLPGKLHTSFPWPMALIIGLFASTLILYTERGNKKRFFYSTAVLLLAFNFSIWPWALSSNRPTLTFLDTYHGNISVLQSDGRTILINSGSKAESTVEEYLLSSGISQIDYLLCFSDKEGDLSNLDSLKSKFNIAEVASIPNIPYTGKLQLPSCSIEYDLALRSKPYYTIKSKRMKVVYVAESQRFTKDTDICYILNRYVDVPAFKKKIIVKENHKLIDSETAKKLFVLRKTGGICIRL